MDKILNNKIAMITGANRGIGMEIAKTLGKNGANIVIIDLKVNDETVKEIESLNVKVLGIECDLTNIIEMNKAIDLVIKTMGKIDILVNNAGVYPAKSIMDVDEKHFDFVVNVNLKGLFFITQAVVKKSMLPNKYGKIVNISSSDGKMPGTGVSIYGATKAGVISLTKSFALELSGTGICSNCVAAGWVESEQVLKSDRWKDVLPKIPSGRLGKLSEIANTVVFLCNDEVSYINGEIIDVNGGLLMD